MIISPSVGDVIVSRSAYSQEIVRICYVCSRISSTSFRLIWSRESEHESRNPICSRIVGSDNSLGLLWSYEDIYAGFGHLLQSVPFHEIHEYGIEKLIGIIDYLKKEYLNDDIQS